MPSFLWFHGFLFCYFLKHLPFSLFFGARNRTFFMIRVMRSGSPSFRSQYISSLWTFALFIINAYTFRKRIQKKNHLKAYETLEEAHKGRSLQNIMKKKRFLWKFLKIKISYHYDGSKISKGIKIFELRFRKFWQRLFERFDYRIWCHSCFLPLISLRPKLCSFWNLDRFPALFAKYTLSEFVSNLWLIVMGLNFGILLHCSVIR